MERRRPRIVSLGFAVPDFAITQDEALELLGYRRPGVKLIFEHSGISKRHSWIDPKLVPLLSWQQQCDAYFEGALNLSVRAIRQCLDNRPVSDISCLVFCSVSGYTCPSMSFWIAREMGMREDIVHCNILGQGCEAGVPSLRRCYDFALTTGKPAMGVATEVCSATYFPAPESDIENTISNTIFSDGSSAAFVGFDEDPYHPEIVDFESQFSAEHIGLLGYRWQDGRLKVVLGKEVPDVVPKLVNKALERLLRRNNLRLADIEHWIIHPGGPAVLRGIENELGLSREQTQSAWDILKEYGNTSSSSIGIIAKMVQHRDNPKGYGIVLTMGAGTSIDLCLVRWP